MRLCAKCLYGGGVFDESSSEFYCTWAMGLRICAVLPPFELEAWAVAPTFSF